MRIEVVLCDHCGGPDFGLGMTQYSVSGGPPRDLCRSCEEKPFRLVLAEHPRVLSVRRAVALLELAP